jgi:hypothetical protein
VTFLYTAGSTVTILYITDKIILKLVLKTGHFEKNGTGSITDEVSTTTLGMMQRVHILSFILLLYLTVH